MKRLIFKLLLLILFLSIFNSCSDNNQSSHFSLEPASNIDVEDYRVYEAIIASNNFHSFILLQKTSGISLADSDENYINQLSEDNSGFEPEMITTLYNSYQNPLYLDNSFNLSSTQVVLIPQAQIDYIFDEDYQTDWIQFYNTFPNMGGLNSFSNVAYNSNHSKALVDASSYCGSLCGLGTLIYLEKENGQWIIKKTVNTWIS